MAKVYTVWYGLSELKYDEDYESYHPTTEEICGVFDCRDKAINYIAEMIQRELECFILDSNWLTRNATREMLDELMERCTVVYAVRADINNVYESRYYYYQSYEVM